MYASINVADQEDGLSLSIGSDVCVKGAELLLFLASYLARQLDGQAAQKQLEFCSCRQLPY